MNPKRKRFGLAILALGTVLSCALIALAQRSDNPPPVVPEVSATSDGNVLVGPRTVPPPALASPEARATYARQIVDRGNAARTRPTDPKQAGQWNLRWLDQFFQEGKDAALKSFPVTEADSTIAGIPVAIYSPKDMPAKHRDKVAMEFEIDAEAIMISNLAKMKVVAVHYRSSPALATHQDIVAVYRELLKTYKPDNIAMFGTSGGCLNAHTTVLWLPELHLPLPGAIGLLSCAGGSSPGDTRFTNNGLDPVLSTAYSGAPPYGGDIGTGNRANPASYKPGAPPPTPLSGDIPKNFPPAFLLAGTRDMCLSETVLLHRKLRNSGVEADLNVFEGMWHAFTANPDLPETREAMTALANFLLTHLGA